MDSGTWCTGYSSRATGRSSFTAGLPGSVRPITAETRDGAGEVARRGTGPGGIIDGTSDRGRGPDVVLRHGSRGGPVLNTRPIPRAGDLSARPHVAPV